MTIHSFRHDDTQFPIMNSDRSVFRLRCDNLATWHSQVLDQGCSVYDFHLSSAPGEQYNDFELLWETELM